MGRVVPAIEPTWDSFTFIHAVTSVIILNRNNIAISYMGNGLTLPSCPGLINLKVVPAAKLPCNCRGKITRQLPGQDLG
jgi:hypothetical protein